MTMKRAARILVAVAIAAAVAPMSNPSAQSPQASQTVGTAVIRLADADLARMAPAMK